MWGNFGGVNIYAYIFACIATTDYKKKELADKKLAKGILFAKFVNFFPLQNFPTFGKCYKEQIVLIKCGAYNNVLTILIS